MEDGDSDRLSLFFRASVINGELDRLVTALATDNDFIFHPVFRGELTNPSHLIISFCVTAIPTVI